MKIEIYDEMKRAIKDALTEWYSENRESLEGVHSKSEDGSNLLTVAQFCEKHPFISEGGMRFRLHNRGYNKLNQCISKAGRRVLIKEKEMLAWFANPPKEAKWTYDENKYPRK